MKIILILLFFISFTTISHCQCTSGNCENGYGIFIFQSGAIFKGTFKNGKLKNGEYFFTNGDVYIGSYENGKRNDENGKYYYSNGKYYEGKYTNGKKVKGKMLYPNGAWYSGEFKNGKRDGYGIYYFNGDKEEEGYWKENKYKGKDKLANAKTLVLIAAIENYIGENDLRYTVDDARALEKVLLNGTLGEIRTENIISLYNSDATKDNVLHSMRELFKLANPEDKVIFYFSGHGMQGMLLPSDYSPFNGNGILHTEVRDEFAKCKAKTKLVIADACYAGSILESKKKSYTKSFATNSSMKNQIAVLMSSRDNETSLESSLLGHGVFTYFLLEALTSSSDVNNDLRITLEELYYFIRNNTLSYCKRKNHEQHPRLIGNFDRNLVLVQL